MSTASAWSVALLGMEGTLVEVEAAIGGQRLNHLAKRERHACRIDRLARQADVTSVQHRLAADAVG